MSSQIAESAVERKRQQNRNSQRTYKKSILKRLEELEKRREASSEETNHLPKCDPVASPTVGSPPSPLPLRVQQDIINFPDLVGFSDLVNWNDGPLIESMRDFNNILMRSSPTSTNLINGNARQGLAQMFSTAEYEGHERSLSEELQHHRKSSDSSTTSNRTSQIQRLSTPLHKAVRAGNEAIVRLLVQYQADIHAVNVQGQTSLHIAIECDHRAITEYLLESGANLNAPDYQGRLPLEMAIVSGNEQLVQLLLAKGANVNLPLVEPT